MLRPVLVTFALVAALPINGCIPLIQDHQIVRALGGERVRYNGEAASDQAEFARLRCDATFDVERARFCFLLPRQDWSKKVGARFVVYVAGPGTAVIESRGLLEWNDQSQTVSPEVRNVPNVAGLTELTLSFAIPHDIKPRYRLTLSGIMVDGRPIAVPPVVFESHAEWEVHSLPAVWP